MKVEVDFERLTATTEDGGIQFRMNFDPTTGRLIGKMRKCRVGLVRDDSSTWVPDGDFRRVLRTLAAAVRDHVERKTRAA